VKSDKSLSWKIGGLYVLYCLYETQFVEPYYLIYLSLGKFVLILFVVINEAEWIYS
jgi:hypothetical protein